MNWVVFSYSLPAKSSSGPRVAVWRRLGRLGAISTTSAVYILPARDECVEALQWLAEETQQAGGDALIMRVDQFEGLTDSQLVELFNAARARDYEAIDLEAAGLEKVVKARKKPETAAEVQEAVAKLRRRYLEIVRVDYFACPAASRVAARLDAIQHSLVPRSGLGPKAPPATPSEYRDKRWVTRPRPHVDRLACAWLIRRFISPGAVIRYANRPEPGEIAFDMSGAQFGHKGNHCTFETLLAAFKLDEPALHVMAEIVHEIDLRDGQYARPGTEGIDAVLSGWLLANFSDADLEAHGIALFEGLYLNLSTGLPAKSALQRPKRRQK
jgi:hypothetical protein